MRAEFIQQVAEQTAIILDPVYSGKTVYGMLRQMQDNPTTFKGRRLLYLHTGTVKTFVFVTLSVKKRVSFLHSFVV